MTFLKEHVNETINSIKNECDNYKQIKESKLQNMKISAKISQQESIDNAIKLMNQLEKQIQLIFQIKKLSLTNDIKKAYELQLRYISN